MSKNDTEFLVQKIRTQYTQKENTKLDELQKLDKKVKKPALVLSIVLGTIGALVMGAGMSLVMTDIGGMLGLAATTVPGIVTGIVGMLIALINYPLYKKVLASRRRKYAKQIIALSDNILK